MYHWPKLHKQEKSSFFLSINNLFTYNVVSVWHDINNVRSLLYTIETTSARESTKHRWMICDLKVKGEKSVKTRKMHWMNLLQALNQKVFYY